MSSFTMQSCLFLEGKGIHKSVDLNGRFDRFGEKN